MTWFNMDGFWFGVSTWVYISVSMAVWKRKITWIDALIIYSTFVLVTVESANRLLGP